MASSVDPLLIKRSFWADNFPVFSALLIVVLTRNVEEENPAQIALRSGCDRQDASTCTNHRRAFICSCWQWEYYNAFHVIRTIQRRGCRSNIFSQKQACSFWRTHSRGLLVQFSEESSLLGIAWPSAVRQSAGFGKSGSGREGTNLQKWNRKLPTTSSPHPFLMSWEAMKMDPLLSMALVSCRCFWAARN